MISLCRHDIIFGATSQIRSIESKVSDFRQTTLIKNLEIRARVIQAIRGFFINSGYLEVETPIRIPAPAPEANIDAIGSEGWFLHTSPELFMKRLLAAGYPRIFQVCRCFRHGERGDLHLPEFTLLEWYCAESEYTEQMALCEDLIRYVAQKFRSTIGNSGIIDYQGEKIDLAKPWQRMTVTEAFETFASISMDEALSRDQYDDAMAFEIEPRLGGIRPVFLYDYPASRGALARLKPGDHRFAERFELYIAGLELCNAFSELADPDEQRRRFEKEIADRDEAGKAVYPMPERFLKALGRMPTAAGCALGVDRLVMLFADSSSIDGVTAFVPEEL